MKTVARGSGYVAIGGVGLLLSAGYLFMAFQLPFGQLDRPGAAIFPVIVGCILAVASLAAMLEGWRAENRSEPIEMPAGEGLKRLAVLAGSLLVYFTLLPWLGQLPASFLFCLALMRVLTDVSGTRVAIAAAIMSLTVYGIFVYLLKVPMPRGILAP